MSDVHDEYGNVDKNGDKNNDHLLKATELKDAHLAIANSYNYILYKWYFILNAGGLVGALTLLSLDKAPKSILILVLVLIILFFLGIVCIIFANKLEIDKFNKLNEQVDLVAELRQKEKINDEAFNTLVNDHKYPDTLTTISEWLSLFFFSSGLLIGIVYFIVTKL